MIRINLAGDAGAGLAGPPPRRLNWGRALQRLVALGVTLGAMGGVLAWRTEQAARSDRLEARIQRARRQRQHQQDLAREIQGLEQRGRSMEGRIRAIERLRALQARPVRVLDLLSDCVQAVAGTAAAGADPEGPGLLGPGPGPGGIQPGLGLHRPLAAHRRIPAGGADPFPRAGGPLRLRAFLRGRGSRRTREGSGGGAGRSGGSGMKEVGMGRHRRTGRTHPGGSASATPPQGGSDMRPA